MSLEHYDKTRYLAELKRQVEIAIAEDVGPGDATTLAIVDPEAKATAQLKSREACVVAGLDVLEFCFAELSQEIVVEINVQDGDGIQPDTVLATIHGPAQAILTGERTALNFMQRLCGIATQTSHYVQAIITGSKTKILDTRKTTPGLRFSEKYAVACGGGTNHRMALYDRVMMKDNHRFLAGQKGPCSISKAIRASRAAFPNLEVEVEVESFDELKEALEGKADQIMLDNMSNKQIEKAIEIRNEIHAETLLEASGGITIERIESLSALNVDYISVGALTHQIHSIDLGLDLDF